MQRAFRLALVLAFFFSLVLPAPTSAEDLRAQIGRQRAELGSRFYAATGHNVSGSFLTFFDRWGGVDVFGYPRTEPFLENGRTVQYFQRARFEYWPENKSPWQVQLALLGDLVLEDPEPPVPPPADRTLRYYPETGHAVGAPFRTLFDRGGDLTIFGYPTSEPYQVGEVTVQRFQRARMEFRPNNPPAYRVQLGLLGDEYISRFKMVPAKELNAVPETPGAQWYIWGAYTTDMAGFIPQKVHNNEVAAKAVDGTIIKPGQVYGFNQVLYAPGYVKGLGYGAKNEYVWVHAGGTCAAATTFYRAAFNAGLPIIEAVEHTLESYYPPGWDATIEEGGQNVRVLNDTPGDLRVRASVDQGSGQMHYWIEGRVPPDRTVVRRGPYQLSEFSYEVFRDTVYADGRTLTERRRVSYVGKPPTVIPPYPGD